MEDIINPELVKGLKAEARKANRIDKGRAEELSRLLAHPGWKVYEEVVSMQVQVLGDQALAPCTSVDQCVGLEGVKGTMRGLLAALHLPSTIIAQMKQVSPSDEESAE